ncbi:MAG: Geranylgeranyl diphosphate synthase, type II [Sporanaerobacter sp.]|jgi:geranylgeranyl diphosphate synthase, type II|uniref:polyprenyl synthetase family protein n=1 Tax=Sporanaerobacter sp. TaxID=2010183 RepID=UPI003A0FCC71
MNLTEEILEIQSVIDDELNSLFIGKSGYQEKIFEAMKYSLFTGGKRIRPILLLKSCQMISGNYEEAIPFALAMEMIHTYSLIHDDLPAMDNDDFRRGNPTNHKVFGEAIAILAGDGLLNLAYEIMIEYILSKSNDKESFHKYTKAFKEICNAAGVDGMIGGQVVDILSDKKGINEIELQFMYECKTAALIEASVVSGGIIGGGNAVEIEALRQYGNSIGIAFQIRDDILDKNSDEKVNKTTYLTYHSLDEAEKEVKRLSENAQEALKIFEDEDTMFLVEFANCLIYRNK